MKKPVKMGIIGCGLAAKQLHWPALENLKDKFEITVVCNHTEAKAKEFAEIVGGVPYVLDYQDVLNNEDVEAVNIILPIELNLQVTRDALAAGKHVIVEKPLAVNLAEADEMMKLDKKYSQVKMVAENFRYRPTFFRAKEMIEKGEIGSPYSVFWNIFSQLTPLDNPYARTQWRINHQYPGGFITDCGVHNMAALRFFFGDFVSGNAFVQGINPDIGKVDTFSFQFRTEQNIDGVFNVYFSANGHSENRIIILGESGSLIVEHNTITKKQTGQEDIVETIEEDGGYKAEFEDFYEALRNDKPVVSNFSEAYRDFEIILKALEGAETGKKIIF